MTEEKHQEITHSSTVQVLSAYDEDCRVKVCSYRVTGKKKTTSIPLAEIYPKEKLGKCTKIQRKDIHCSTVHKNRGLIKQIMLQLFSGILLR